MILITGATGTNGTLLTELLAAHGVPFRAMVRSESDREAFASMTEAEVVLGDFNDPASVERALDGIERAFLVTPSSEQAEEQQRAFVQAARRAGAEHLVKLSQLAASEDSPVRFLRYHAAVERVIEESGLAYTFLRPNLYMQGLLNFRSSIVQGGTFFVAAGEAKVSVVDVRDIAAAAAAALTEAGHAGKTYDLTGPEALTHAEMAATLSEVLGKPVTFVDVEPAVMRETMVEIGLPTWQADGLVEDYAHYRRGEASEVKPGVEEVTGEQPRSFEAFARDYADAFS